jgi:hypothetical protein
MSLDAGFISVLDALRCRDEEEMQRYRDESGYKYGVFDSY